LEHPNHWRLTWNPSIDDITPSGLISYHVAIGTNPGVYDMVSDYIVHQRGEPQVGNAPQPYFQTTITNKKEFYWKICALDDQYVSSAWSAEQKVVTNMPLATLVSPLNAQLSTTKPDFIWTVSFSESNRVMISTDPGFGSLTYSVLLDGNTTSHTPPLDLPEGLYYWQVATKKLGINFYRLSDPSTFSIDFTAPSNVLLVFPASNQAITNQNPGLTWTTGEDNASGISNYIIEIRQDETNGDLVYDLNISATNTNLWFGYGDYYWKIQARDRSGNVDETGTGWSLFRVMPYPAMVSNVSSFDISSNALRLTWLDNVEEEKYLIYRNTDTNFGTALKVGSVTQNMTSHLDTSNLAANTWYYYWVQSSNSITTGPIGNIASNCTFAVFPNITNRKPEAELSTNADYVFTNHALSGTGGLHGYYYAWNLYENYTITTNDSYWDVFAGTIFQPFNNGTNEGVYYFHVASCNSNGRISYQGRMGPYRYFLEKVSELSLQTSRTHILDNGIDTAILDNSLRLTNIWSAGINIKDGRLFYIVFESGTNELVGVEYFNDKAYVTSSNGNIQFGLRGTFLNIVDLMVYWEGAPEDVYDTISIRVSPEMTFQEAELVDRILNPELGEVLEIVVDPSHDGEVVEITVVDIRTRKVVYHAPPGVVYEWLPVVYNLQNNKNKDLPDGIYGVFIKGEDWYQKLKFTVNRWYGE